MDYLVTFSVGRNELYVCRFVIKNAQSEKQAFEIAFQKYLNQNPEKHSYYALDSYWMTAGSDSSHLNYCVARISSDGSAEEVSSRELRKNPDLFAWAEQTIREHGIDVERIKTKSEKNRQAAISWSWDRP